MRLEDILEKYCIVYSPECDFLYGITTQEDAEEISNKYELSETVSFDFDTIVPITVLDEITTEDNPVLTAKKMDEIIKNNLIIPLKKQDVTQ